DHFLEKKIPLLRKQDLYLILILQLEGNHHRHLRLVGPFFRKKNPTFKKAGFIFDFNSSIRR
ncbi:hypothetical protein, partial [Chryseobacterium sp. CH25]|uniref:hypothetical protein n=1 Tax=Chryseobacterium sp. CH25 TaxID=713559 RepID=UPI001E5599E3